MADKQRRLPELLAPAGDMERLKMAVLYGADAVYLAGTDLRDAGLRRELLTRRSCKAAVAYAHAHGVTGPLHHATPCPGATRSSACRRIWNG